MKTDLIVSCPHCGKENVVKMKLVEENFLPTKLLLELLPEAKQYAFSGDTECSACGKAIIGTLTVTG